MTDAQEYREKRWIALALLCMAQFVVVLDASIVNVALPTIGEALSFSQDNLSWVVNAYVLTFGGFLLLGGRLADWRIMASLVGIIAVQLVIYALMLQFAGSPWIMAALVLIWGGTAFAFGSPVQTRILSNTQDAPLLAASLIPSAFNVAIAAGAWFGGALIDGGYSYGVLPWAGVIGTAIAVAVAAISWNRERRG